MKKVKRFFSNKLKYVAFKIKDRKMKNQVISNNISRQIKDFENIFNLTRQESYLTKSGINNNASSIHNRWYQFDFLKANSVFQYDLKEFTESNKTFYSTFSIGFFFKNNPHDNENLPISKQYVVFNYFKHNDYKKGTYISSDKFYLEEVKDILKNILNALKTLESGVNPVSFEKFFEGFILKHKPNKDAELISKAKEEIKIEKDKLLKLEKKKEKANLDFKNTDEKVKIEIDESDEFKTLENLMKQLDIAKANFIEKQKEIKLKHDLSKKRTASINSTEAYIQKKSQIESSIPNILFKYKISGRYIDDLK